MGSINEEQENESSNVKSKSGKEPTAKAHKAPFGGLKKLIDREKDKDKDKDKDKEKEKDKEKDKEKNVIKSGFNETKENVKKLMSKDRQHSRPSLPPNTETVENHHNNNGDLKHPSPSPLVHTKRPSEIIMEGGIELTSPNEKSISDVLSLSKIDGAVSNGSHGIISPFEALNNDDSDSDDAIVDHPHQQLSSSSSASVNILMDSNSNNKMMGKVQVSQV